MTTPRPRGRPRSPSVDEAILDAALELLIEEGLPGTTISAVAARSGVARATIYLRWPTRDALITAAFVHAKGRPPFRLTGDLETDLETGAEWARAIFSEPAFRAVLPLVVRVLLDKDRSDSALTYDALAPNRQLAVEEYALQAPEAGLRTDVDALLISDMIVGGLLNRLLATGMPPTHEDAQHVVDVVLNGVRTGSLRRRRRRRAASA
jgi:AcrR family transcriptional regulator